MPGCDLQQSFANVVIRASAGTGKTFQLSNRFLALVHAGERPDHLIAATFARKAAGEILERVLLRLAEAATDPEQLRRLAGCIPADAGGGAVDRECCVTLLRRLVAHLHRLRIGTLDSLFVQMAGTFAFELGLPPGWRIVDEVVDRRLRDAAVQDVLAGSSASAVVTMMHLLNRGEARRSVSEQVRLVTDGLYTTFCEAALEAWDCIPRSTRLDAPQLRAAIARVAEFDGLPADKRFAAARAADVAHAEADDWSQFLSKGIAAKVHAGEPRYYGKDIPSPLVDAYEPLIEHARSVLIGQLADQTRATCALLEQFDRAYERLKHRERALRFEDVTRALARAVGDGRLGELAFRMDLNACQILLDEFQDTSLPQWQVLRPLAERAAREPGRSFFCVGDVKQAIYGWRGGVSELFEALGRQLPGLETLPLDQSFRSSQPVIDVVNTVFGSLGECPVLAKYPRVTNAWSERFRAHSTARDDLAGYVRIETPPLAEPAGAEEQRRLTLQHAAALAARLHREHPGCSIGLLVRRNAAVARLIYNLRQEHQLIASEEGGNPLTDSAGVQLILSLLVLADHPGHTIAGFHVARSPLGKALGFTDFEDRSVARRLAREIRAALVHAGYGPTILDWVRQLAPACDTRELSRLTQLVALAYRYESEATERADDFVRYVRATKVEDPLSADVRVMTVHQAKGLEFDIVILPELDGRLCGQTPPVLVGRPDPAGPVNAVCRYPRAELRALLPARFEQMHGDWQYLEINEDLCVLYVAMTRAVHALHLVVPPSAPSETAPPVTAAGVLRAALCGTQPAPPEAVLYEHGDAAWSRSSSCPAGEAASLPSAPETSATRPTTEPLTIRLAEASARRTRGLERHSPSGLQGGTVVRLEQRLFTQPSTAADRGTLWHAWLEQVEWLDDGEPDDEALLRQARRLATAGLDVSAELAAFRRLLKTPEMQNALSRTAYQTAGHAGWPPEVTAALQAGTARLLVEREHGFALREEDAILTGSIDRLVLALSNGQEALHNPAVLAAHVLDFKTDQIEGDERLLSERSEYYRPQLDGYRRAVAALYGLRDQAVTTRLMFLTPLL